MISPEDERARPPSGPGGADIVSFAWADPRADVFGLARLGLSTGRDGSTAHASALSLLFHGGEITASELAGDLPVAEPTWAALEAGALSAETIAPLGEWRIVHRDAFDLRFRATSSPLELGAGGLEGYEQLCLVSGTIRAGGAERALEGVGQRGHAWGTPDWEELESLRQVSVWLGPEEALLLQSAHAAGASGHADDETAAVLVDGPGPDGGAVAVAEPRLSTTYDAEGRQRRAGLELWVGEEDDYPRRAAGQVACGTSLEVGRLTLNVAFFQWTMDGRAGLGRYELLRRP